MKLPTVIKLLTALPLVAACAAPVDEAAPGAARTSSTEGTADYSDLDFHWAADAIVVLSTNGILVEGEGDERRLLLSPEEEPVFAGHGDGTFGPDELLTREQFSAMAIRLRPDLVTAHGDDCSDERAAGVLGEVFLDGGQVSRWAERAVCIASRGGIIQGKRLDGTEKTVFDPQAQLTHSELLAMLRRVFDWYEPILPPGDTSNALLVDCSRLADSRWARFCDQADYLVRDFTTSNGWDHALVWYARRHYVAASDDAWFVDLATDPVTRAEAAATVYMALSDAFAFEILKTIEPDEPGYSNPFNDDDGCIPESLVGHLVGADHHVGEVADKGDRNEGHDSLTNNICSL